MILPFALAGFFFVSSALAADLTVTILPPAGPAPTRAYDFYSKIGAQFEATQISNNDAVGMLNNLGIKLLRFTVYGESDFQRAADLAARGFKMHLMFQAYNLPSQNMANLMGWLKTYLVIPHPGSVVSVGGPNEVNLAGHYTYNGQTDVAGANLFQRDLHAAIHADAAFAGIQVAMWPLAFPWTDQANNDVGNQTAYCDIADVHGYPGLDNWNSVFGSGQRIPDQIQSYVNVTHRVCNRPTFINSEWGFCTPLHANCPASINSYSTEYTAARMSLIVMIEHAKRSDNLGTFIFTLCCGATEPPDVQDQGGWWAIYHYPGSPKISATAIANFMSIVADNGPTASTFAAAPFSYTLNGMPALGRNYVIAKSNGKYQILLWQNTPIWNQNNDTQLAIPDSSVTVSLPRGMQGSVFNPVVNGTTPVQTFVGKTSVTVALNDAPIVVEVQ